MESVTKAEAKLIAREAAEVAIEKHAEQLPTLLKPVMYEVAENVAERTENAFIELFSRVLSVDVKDSDKVRDLQKDLFFLSDNRQATERVKSVARDTATAAIVKWTGIGAVAAFLAWLGVNIKH